MPSIVAAGKLQVAMLMQQAALAAMKVSLQHLNHDTVYLILAATHDFDDLRHLALTCSLVYKVFAGNARLLEIKVLRLSPGASSGRAVGSALRYIRIAEAIQSRGIALNLLERHKELNYLLATHCMSRHEAEELQRLSHVADWLEMCYIHKCIDRALRSANLPDNASAELHVAIYRASLLGALSGGNVYLSKAHSGIRLVGKKLGPFVNDFGQRKTHLYESFTSTQGPPEKPAQRLVQLEMEWFRLDCLRRWITEESWSIDVVSSRANSGSRLFLQLGPRGFLEAILSPNEQKTSSHLDSRLRWDEDMGQLLQLVPSYQHINDMNLAILGAHRPHPAIQLSSGSVLKPFAEVEPDQPDHCVSCSTKSTELWSQHNWQMLAAKVNFSEVINLLPGQLPSNETESRYFRRFILDRARNPDRPGYPDRPERDIPVDAVNPAQFRLRATQDASFGSALDDMLRQDNRLVMMKQYAEQLALAFKVTSANSFDAAHIPEDSWSLSNAFKSAKTTAFLMTVIARAVRLGYSMLNGDITALKAVAFCAGSVDDVLHPYFDAEQTIIHRLRLYEEFERPLIHLLELLVDAVSELDASPPSNHFDTVHYHEHAVAEIESVLNAIKAFDEVPKDVALQRLRDADCIPDHSPTVVITIPLLLAKLLTLDAIYPHEKQLLCKDSVAVLDLDLDSWICLECVKTKVVAERAWLVWYRAKERGLVTGQPLQPDCLHGMYCDKQVTSKGHARTFNHACLPTVRTPQE